MGVTAGARDQGLGARDRRRVTSLVTWLACSCLATGALAQEVPDKRLKGFATPEEQPVTAQLIAEHTSIQPGGETRIGVLFELEDGWHIYAEEPGDAGLPTSVDWVVPEGLSLGSLHWPPHEEFLSPGEIQTFGYHEAVVLSTTAALSATADPQATIPIRANAGWLACKEVCIPGSAALEMALPIRAGTPRPSPHAELLRPSSDPST